MSKKEIKQKIGYFVKRFSKERGFFNINSTSTLVCFFCCHNHKNESEYMNEKIKILTKKDSRILSHNKDGEGYLKIRKNYCSKHNIKVNNNGICNDFCKCTYVFKGE